MMILAVIFAFAAGVCGKLYTSTGDLSYVVVSVVLSVACLITTLGWFMRESGQL